MVAWGDVPTWVGASASLATFGVAIGAAIAAFRQVHEARKLREAQAQPFVVIDFEPTRGVGHPFMDIVIRNVGQTLAKDVTFEFTPQLHSKMYQGSPQPLSEIAIFRDGISSIPPGREYRILFDKMPDYFADSEMPRRYDVVVRFWDYSGRPQEPLHQVLDLEIYRQAQQITEHGVHHIAKTLRAWARKNGVTSFY